MNLRKMIMDHSWSCFPLDGSSWERILPPGVSTQKTVNHLLSEFRMREFGIRIERLVIQVSIYHRCVQAIIHHSQIVLVTASDIYCVL